MDEQGKVGVSVFEMQQECFLALRVLAMRSLLFPMGYTSGEIFDFRKRVE